MFKKITRTEQNVYQAKILIALPGVGVTTKMQCSAGVRALVVKRTDISITFIARC